MTDERLRELERRARGTGAPRDWLQYLSSGRDGPEASRDRCYTLLAEDNTSARTPALQQLALSGGVWIEQVSGDNVRIHGVPYRTCDGPHTPHTFTWMRLATPPAEWTHEQITTFLRGWEFNGEKFVLPTIAERYATAKAAYTAQQHERQEDAVLRVVPNFMRYDLYEGCLTSDARVATFEEGITNTLVSHVEISRAHGRPDQRTIDPKLGNGYGGLSLEQSQILFDTTDDLATINAVFASILGPEHTPWYRTMEFDHTPFQPLHMQTRRMGDGALSTGYDALAIETIPAESVAPARVVSIKPMVL